MKKVYIHVGDTVNIVQLPDGHPVSSLQYTTQLLLQFNVVVVQELNPAHVTVQVAETQEIFSKCPAPEPNKCTFFAFVI